MGWRKTATFHAPQEILVMTCDVCERDIGYEDERRPREHYEIARLHGQRAIDEQNPTAYVCSPQCLRAFAAKASGEADRPPPGDGRFKPRGKPAK
jgi:hypothetical protein